MLAHHFSHYYSWRRQQMVSKLAGVISPSGTPTILVEGRPSTFLPRLPPIYLILPSTILRIHSSFYAIVQTAPGSTYDLPFCGLPPCSVLLQPKGVLALAINFARRCFDAARLAFFSVRISSHRLAFCLSHWIFQLNLSWLCYSSANSTHNFS